MTLNEYMTLFPDMDMTAFLIGAIVGALISAFFGFRLFRFSVVVSFASAGFLLGYVLFDTLFPDGVESIGLDIGLIVGLALAVILGILALKIYKGLVYLVGGMLGALLGFVIIFFVFDALELPHVGLLLGIAVAVLLAILFAKGFMKLMKAIVIIETALGGMALAFEAAATLLVANESVILVASFVGFFLGIPAAVYQFKANKGVPLFGTKD